MEIPFINVHTHWTSNNENNLCIVNLDLNQPCPEQGYYSYGIHPWALDNADFQMEKIFSLLEEKLQSPNVLALGEAGLDKMHKDGFEQQIVVFERQIKLSETLQKPMILHGFNGTEQDIQQLTGQGLFISVGESVLHSERKIAKSLISIPLDLLFLETDMAEIGIETVYETAAKILDIDIAVLQRRIFANFARLFGLEK